MEQFFTIIIFIVAVIFSAIMRKKRSEAEDTDAWPESPSSPGESGSPPPKRLSWEEELKRLLEGDTTPAPTPAPPPPIIRQPAPRPAKPAPAPAPAPQPWMAPTPAKSAPLHDWTKRKPAPSPVLEQALLTQSAQAHERAQQLDEKVAARMRETARRVETHDQSVQIKSDSIEVRTALELLRKPDTLRAAWIAAIVLGPPKSMENSLTH